jgi:GDP-mannose 6-dehydrogenase
LRPGFAFGGSCLPKDLRAITYKARNLDLEIPLLNSIIQSNQVHIDRTIATILGTGKKKVGMLGLSFKAGTDDLRESPMVTLAEALIGKGIELRIYDKNVSLARLVGANKDYIEKEIPHISSLMRDTVDEVVADADVIVIGNKAPEFVEAITKIGDDKIVYDLVRVLNCVETAPSGYEGVCW